MAKSVDEIKEMCHTLKANLRQPQLRDMVDTLGDELLARIDNDETWEAVLSPKPQDAPAPSAYDNDSESTNILSPIIPSFRKKKKKK